MELNPPSSSDTAPAQTQKRRTPWGAIIGLILILAIVVGGAYYSFTKRYQPPHTTPPVQSH